MDAYVIVNGKATTVQALEEAQKYQNRKRYRATGIVFIGDKLLLVRDKGRDDYSMVGGGFHKNEHTVEACIRELNEEVGGITIESVERLKQCDFEGRRAKYKVSLIKASGKPYVKSKEIVEVILWNMKDKIKTQGHISHILEYYKKEVK
jgi:hypothetical protein